MAAPYFCGATILKKNDNEAFKDTLILSCIAPFS